MESMNNEEQMESMNNEENYMDKMRLDSKPGTKKPEVLRVELPVGSLINASRRERKAFFIELLRNINLRLNIIRLERKIKKP